MNSHARFDICFNVEVDRTISKSSGIKSSLLSVVRQTH